MVYGTDSRNYCQTTNAIYCWLVLIIVLIALDIRIQQRNGRKTLTTVQGLPKDFDQKRILKAFKKDFACNGTLVNDDELGEVIQLQGDHRAKVGQFLINEKIAKKEDVKIHGF